MRALAEQFWGRVIRIVVADRPAISYPVNQPPALEDLCNLLADCTEAKRVLRAKGYGDVGMTILEIVSALPLKTAGHATTPKRKGKR